MNAIDLFSGAGGLSIALEKHGFDILFANEINPQFAETYTLNYPSVPMICDDINNISLESVKQYIGEKEVDLMVGGPPCQGFSVFGKRRFINTKEYDPHTDPRNALVYQYIRLVQELKPKFFLWKMLKVLLT